MAQTDLRSDAFCLYNQSAAPLEWTLQRAPQQGYNNTFAIGTVGINADSSYVRPDVINIDSYLSGRDDILSKCNPPLPSLDEANEAPLMYENQGQTNYLQPIYTREKKAAVNLSAVSYLPLTFNPDLKTPPQDINHIIFAGAAQRGGANTSNIIKSAWNSDSCEYFLDPQRYCGRRCSEVNGYMTRLPYSKDDPEARWGKLPTGLPSGKWYNPSMTNTQIGVAAGRTPLTSQLATSVGADNGGPQYVVPVPGTISHKKLPVISNPYAAPPTAMNPFTGQPYNHNSLYPLVAQ
jgi:hypothetical protein